MTRPSHLAAALPLLTAAAFSPPAQATQPQIVTPFFVAMLAGPASDGPSVILVKKRDNFISWETPMIACISGFAAGSMAAGLPALAATTGSGGALAPVSFTYLAGYGLYGCVVSAVGGAIGVATEMALAEPGEGEGQGEAAPKPEGEATAPVAATTPAATATETPAPAAAETPAPTAAETPAPTAAGASAPTAAETPAPTAAPAAPG